MHRAGPLDGTRFRRGQRLERHPTLRTWTGPSLTNFRMHRAGVDRSFRRRVRLGKLRRQVFRGLRGKPFPASPRAKIIRAPGMHGAVLGLMGIDSHAAHRILDEVLLRRDCLRLMRLMTVLHLILYHSRR